MPREASESEGIRSTSRAGRKPFCDDRPSGFCDGCVTHGRKLSQERRLAHTRAAGDDDMRHRSLKSATADSPFSCSKPASVPPEVQVLLSVIAIRIEALTSGLSLIDGKEPSTQRRIGGQPDPQRIGVGPPFLQNPARVLLDIDDVHRLGPELVEGVDERNRPRVWTKPVGSQGRGIWVRPKPGLRFILGVPWARWDPWTRSRRVRDRRRRQPARRPGANLVLNGVGGT
jgi:hypothetical protein